MHTRPQGLALFRREVTSNVDTSPATVAASTTSPGRLRNGGSESRAMGDVTKISAPTDLGVPAFNAGSPKFSTGDYDNGLGLMINGVQYVYVLATHYVHEDTWVFRTDVQETAPIA